MFSPMRRSSLYFAVCASTCASAPFAATRTKARYRVMPAWSRTDRWSRRGCRFTGVRSQLRRRADGRRPATSQASTRLHRHAKRFGMTEPARAVLLKTASHGRSARRRRPDRSRTDRVARPALRLHARRRPDQTGALAVRDEVRKSAVIAAARARQRRLAFRRRSSPSVGAARRGLDRVRTGRSGLAEEASPPPIPISKACAAGGARAAACQARSGFRASCAPPVAPTRLGQHRAQRAAGDRGAIGRAEEIALDSSMASSCSIIPSSSS